MKLLDNKKMRLIQPLSDSSVSQTRTKATVERYLTRAHGLLVRIADEMQLPEDAYPPPKDVVHFMEQNARNWKWATFRQYQASLVCRYELEFEKTRYKQFEETAVTIKQLPYINCIPEKTVGQSSSKKRKGILKKDFHLLMRKLSNPVNHSVYAQKAAIWLASGIATGLRPCEWEGAVLNTNKGVLIVKNAKATNGRGTGETREVPIELAFIETVQEHLQNVTVALSTTTFAKFHALCSNALHRGCRAMWGDNPAKYYSLYSGRHQFTANAKALYSHETVATLLGHKSIRTARTHYAPKRSAWNKQKPEMKFELKIRQVLK